jgi:hypothetical protein
VRSQPKRKQSRWRRPPKIQLPGRVAVDQAKAQKIVQDGRGLQLEDLPTLVLETPPFWRYPMTTRSTALCSSERSLASLRGSRLTPERNSKSSDLGARIHSVPRSSRRHGARAREFKLECQFGERRRHAGAGGANAQIFKPFDQFQNRPTAGLSPPEGQAMTASLKSTLRAWISTEGLATAFCANGGNKLFRVKFFTSYSDRVKIAFIIACSWPPES